MCQLTESLVRIRRNSAKEVWEGLRVAEVVGARAWRDDRGLCVNMIHCNDELLLGEMTGVCVNMISTASVTRLARVTITASVVKGNVDT